MKSVLCNSKTGRSDSIKKRILTLVLAASTPAVSSNNIAQTYHDGNWVYNYIHVIYTKEHETAGAYIERLANEIGKNESVRGVSSDSLIRLSALRSGVLRTSAKGFCAEVEQVSKRIEQAVENLNRA